MAVAVLLLLIAGIWWMKRPAGITNDMANINVTPAATPTEKVSDSNTSIKLETAPTQNSIAANNITVQTNNSATVALQNNAANKLAVNKSASALKTVTAKNDDVKAAQKTPVANIVNTTTTPVDVQQGSNADVAVVKEPIIDKPMKIETNETANVQFASNNSNDEPLYIGNTSINKKNALRGIFRKASRVIERGGNIVEGNGKKGILIGNIEIGLK
jgi:hypothetical protein